MKLDNVREFQNVEIDIVRGNIIPNRNILNNCFNCLILKFHNIINRAMIIIIPQYGSICYERVVHLNFCLDWNIILYYFSFTQIQC